MFSVVLYVVTVCSSAEARDPPHLGSSPLLRSVCLTGVKMVVGDFITQFGCFSETVRHNEGQFTDPTARNVKVLF